MKFRDWLDSQEPGTRARLIRLGRVTESCIARAQRGMAISYGNADRLSALTGGQVSIADLCQPGKRGKR